MKVSNRANKLIAAAIAQLKLISTEPTKEGQLVSVSSVITQVQAVRAEIAGAADDPKTPGSGKS